MNDDEDDLTHYFNATGRMRERAEAAEAERDQLRESVRPANTAAEAAAETVGNMAEKCSTLMAERDQLRAVLTDTWCALFGADRVGEGVELLSTEHAAMIPDTVRSTMVASNEVLRAVEAERDRMRDELEAGVAQWIKEAKHAASRIGEGNRELDRLRAVVDAVRRYVPLIEAPVAAVDPQERLAVHLELLRRLRELDGSTEPTDG